MISMNAIAWVGVFIVLGVLLRAKIPFLKKNLIPASVIGGVLGFIVMNTGVITTATSGEFSGIAANLWSFSFASLGLTLALKKKAPKKQQTMKERMGNSQFSGICGMGFFWVIPYALTGIIAFATLALVGGFFDMPAIHGLQIPFAFAQGPGQSVTYGGMMEGNGVVNAVQVGVTFAALGFLVAFLIGVPWVKKGIKKGLAPYAGEMDESMLSGVIAPEKQEYYGKQTTHPGNVDTLAFHFSLVGIAWIGGTYICQLFSLIPGFFGEMMSGFLYLYGMLVAYGLKWVICKLGYDKYLDRGTQMRISGFCIDMMVAAAFMAISLEVIGMWLVPILIVVLVTSIFTYATTRFFGERFGGKHGFERTVAIWGCLTGTNASGQALCRMTDPDRKTSVMEELGPINAINVPACYVVMPAIIAFSAMEMSLMLLTGILCAVAVIFFIAMVVTGTIGKKTYSYKKGELYYKVEDEELDENPTK